MQPVRFNRNPSNCSLDQQIMLRHVTPGKSFTLLIRRPFQGIIRSFATKRGGDADEAELDAARKWLANLDTDTIPRSIGDVSFSRSSGPGGQNVNKYV